MASIAIVRPDVSIGQHPASPIPIARVGGVITLDGIISDSEWISCTPISLVMHMPEYNTAPSERSEILFGYDDAYLYIGARLLDSEPGSLRSGSRQRDELTLGNDWLGIILDTFNDKENALSFMTTPAGLRTDFTIFNDGVGDYPINESWNTYWDVGTRADETGWFAEIRIPFTSLRFQDRNGSVTMGLIVWRWIARKSEADIFPAIPPKWGWWSQVKPSQAREILFEGIYSRSPLYITPYLLGGIGLHHDLNEEETIYVREDKLQHEAGVDIKLGLTSNMTLDLTLNTDFAQVEADDQQVNLTRFSLFFPEKRLFFQERSSIFDFALGGLDKLFYSRQIGIYDEQPVRLIGGARLIGRTRGWDVGFLDMQSASVADRKSENHALVRVRRKVLNAYSSIGAIITSRIQSDGTYNSTYGTDGILRLFGDDYLTYAWAQSFESGRKNNALSMKPSHLWVLWDRRSMEGFSYQASLGRSGEEFEPGMGFTQRSDFTHAGMEIRCGWLPATSSWLFSHQGKARGTVYLRNTDRVVESLQIGPQWDFTMKSGYGLQFLLLFNREEVNEEFELSDEADIPIGSYRFVTGEASFSTPGGSLLYLEGNVAVGSYYDGRQTSFTLSPIYFISTDFRLSGTYRFDRIHFPERDALFRSHIGRIRALLTFSTDLSASAFLQYSSSAHLLIVNFRLRYNPREGNDLYLVYNETLHQDRDRDRPVRPAIQDRAILVKYSHTFQL